MLGAVLLLGDFFGSLIRWYGAYPPADILDTRPVGLICDTALAVGANLTPITLLIALIGLGPMILRNLLRSFGKSPLPVQMLEGGSTESQTRKLATDRLKFAGLLLGVPLALMIWLKEEAHRHGDIVATLHTKFVDEEVELGRCLLRTGDKHDSLTLETIRKLGRTSGSVRLQTPSNAPKNQVLRADEAIRGAINFADIVLVYRETGVITELEFLASWAGAVEQILLGLKSNLRRLEPAEQATTLGVLKAHCPTLVTYLEDGPTTLPH